MPTGRDSEVTGSAGRTVDSRGGTPQAAAAHRPPSRDHRLLGPGSAQRHRQRHLRHLLRPGPRRDPRPPHARGHRGRAVHDAAALRRRSASGRTQVFEATLPDTRGVARRFEASYIPDIVDGEVRGFYCHAIDVTARVEAERVRDEALRLFQISMANAPIGEALLTTDGRALRINPALCQLIGAHRRGTRGQELPRLRPPRRSARRDRRAPPARQRRGLPHLLRAALHPAWTGRSSGCSATRCWRPAASTAPRT